MPLNPPIVNWQGRRVWLVGASSGIGRALAARLHAAGARVALSARSADALASFAAEHPGSLALALDATDRQAMRAAGERIVRDWGGIDLAVYCAGYYKAMRATAFDLDDALRHQQVNYVGALVMLDAVLPALLRQQSGHVSLISSVSGYRGLPKALAYGPTKAALINLAESMWFDLTDRGIGVSVVCPGYVDTPLTEQNDYRMPALISAEQAAAQIEAGWRRGDFHLHFPKRFTGWIKALSHLGDATYFRAVRRFTGL
jgi:NAD(P)-dependent dehydrogenase (short-subunit alcohol dehydrogenase family)